MWGRLERKRRRRTGRGEALKDALSALEGVRGRYGRSRSSRRGGGGGGRAYGDIAGLGVGVVAMVLTILLLLWLVRRLSSENAPPATEAPEAGVEEAPPEETP